MKKIFLLMVFCLLAAVPVQAMVVTGEEDGESCQMKYPVIYVSDPAAQEAINDDLSRYLDAFRAAMADDERIVNGATEYILEYEDDDVVSLLFRDYRYLGGAHGTTVTYGLVYDKHSGARIPLDNYLRVTPADLNEAVYDHLYNGTGKPMPYTFAKWNRPIDYVPEDYFLLGNGGIAVLFQPYALGCYADGYTTIRFDAGMVAQYNARND